MKQKQIIILGVIFGVLAFGILLKSWVRSMADHASAASGGTVAFVGFDPSKLEKVLISRGNRSLSVELVKEQGVWKVKSLWSAKADFAKVERLIQRLGSVQGELRGSGEKLFEDFGIRDEDAFSVKFLGSGNSLLQDLRIGTKQPGENGYFIRKASGKEVYFTDVNMAELLGVYTSFKEAVPESLFWADLRLFNLDPEQVTKINVDRLKDGKMSMVAGVKLEKDPKDLLKNSWAFQRQDVASLLDAEKVLKFIAVMNSVRAEKVVDPGMKGYGLEKPVWQLTVAEGDKKTVLMASPKNEKEEVVYVKHPEDPTVFSVKASFFDDLNVDDTNFFKDVPPIAAPSKKASPNLAVALPERQKKTI